MKPLLISFILLVIFSSCGDSPENVELPPFENQDIAVTEKMKLAISNAYFEQLNLPDSLVSYLQSYYSARKYEPRWINDSILTTEGVRLKKVLSKSHEISIPKNRLFHVNTKNYIQDEIYITLGLSRVVADLKHGIIDYENKVARPKTLCPVEAIDQNIQFDSSIELRTQFLKFGPNDSTYQALGKGLIAFVDTHELDTTTFNIKSIKYDSLGAIEKTTKALLSKGYLKKSTKDSTELAESLAQFQQDNMLKPDAVIGKYTSMALNESTYHKMERVLVSMDKIRSQTPRPSKYIRINIPEYKLRLYINDSLKSEHNLVVGSMENQTPELNSKLRKIVVYPYWNVPYSIASKEILPAVQRNVGYLEKHDYEIFRKDELIDPHTVNWRSIRQNSFPYKVRQLPGPKNSLGIIKFDFFNEHSVYFHDTPAKSLFGVDVRAYSHGCMRTQNPVDLAKIILERDEYNNKFNEIVPDSLDTLLGRGENYEIRLLDPIPIFVEYQTVTRSDTTMTMFIDIYGRDEEYIKILHQ